MCHAETQSYQLGQVDKAELPAPASSALSIWLSWQFQIAAWHSNTLLIKARYIALFRRRTSLDNVSKIYIKRRAIGVFLFVVRKR